MTNVARELAEKWFAGQFWSEINVELCESAIREALERAARLNDEAAVRWREQADSTQVGDGDWCEGRADQAEASAAFIRALLEG